MTVARLDFAFGLAQANRIGVAEVVAHEVAAEDAGIGGEGAAAGGHAGRGGSAEPSSASMVEEFEGVLEAFGVVFDRADLDADVARAGGAGRWLDGAAAHREGEAVGKQGSLAVAAFGEDDGEAALIEAGEEITSADDPAERVGDVLDGEGGGGGPEDGLHLFELADANDGEGERVRITLGAGDIAGEGFEEVLARGEMGLGIDEWDAGGVIIVGLGHPERLETAEEDPAETGGGGDEDEAYRAGVGDGNGDLANEEDAGQRIGGAPESGGAAALAGGPRKAPREPGQHRAGHFCGVKVGEAWH